MRLLIAFVCLCPAFLVSLCLGQEGQLVRPGPLGRPTLVLDEGEGETWNTPIRVYSDSNTDIFVSDQLTLAGIYLDGPYFKKDGRYTTYFYSHYKTDHDCRIQRVPKGHEKDTNWLEACTALRYNRRLVSIDTRRKVAVVLGSALMQSDGQFHPDLFDTRRVTIPLDGKINPALTEAVRRTTHMLVSELSRHPDIK